MSVALVRHRFTVDEYYRMAQAGIFSEDDRVELLDGEIVERSPIDSKHAGCVKGLTHFFGQKLGDRAVVGVQDPIRLGEYSEPQPDLALLKPRADFYRNAHPTAEDVLLVVEVADTSCSRSTGSPLLEPTNRFNVVIEANRFPSSPSPT